MAAFRPAPEKPGASGQAVDIGSGQAYTIAKARKLFGFEPRHRVEVSLGEPAESGAVVGRGAQMRRELEERGLVP